MVPVFSLLTLNKSLTINKTLFLQMLFKTIAHLKKFNSDIFINDFVQVFTNKRQASPLDAFQDICSPEKI